MTFLKTESEIRLILTVKKFVVLREIVKAWMNEEAHNGRLRINSDCPRWSDFESAHKEMLEAINAVGAEHD
jgi:hypothetical protein